MEHYIEDFVRKSCAIILLLLYISIKENNNLKKPLKISVKVLTKKCLCFSEMNI